MTTYTVTLTPVDNALATRVLLTLFGTKGTSAEFCPGAQDRTGLNSYRVKVICDLGEMQRVRVCYNDPGIGPKPHLEEVVIQESGTLRTWHFPCRSRFAGFAERMLDPEPASLAA